VTADTSTPDSCATGRRRAPIGVRRALGAFILFALLAVAHTWPLATAPGTLSRNDTADTVLHEWIMAWVAHQIVTDPIHLFDANIFYPERRTLAYSDHLFVQSMMGAPLAWAGASPVLVHNLVLLAGFALTGWTACLALWWWTGSATSGVVAGSLLAFNSFTLTRLPQIQDLHLEFFPLALVALDRLLTEPRTSHALSLAGWFVLQSLTGTYLMVFTTMALVTASLARPGDWIGPRFRRIVPKALVASAVAVVVLLPFLLPYSDARDTVGLGRSLDETERYSAVFTDYLAGAGRLHFDTWSARFFEGDALFPGLVALALAGYAAATGGWREPRQRMVLAVGVMAFALSFGPAFPPYRWLYRVFPPLTGIRGAVRFGQIVLAALAILAGFGGARLTHRVGPRLATIVGVLAVLAVNAEAWRAPLYYAPYGGIPPVYDTLQQVARRAVLVWFPFFGSAQFHQNAPFMLVSTRTFNPMLNGYSGFKPASFYRHVEALATFPDDGSIRYLQEAGVSVVLVDGRNMRPSALARLPEFPQLTLVTTDGNLRIYLLTPGP
jgi:hypothetical protein